MAKKKHPSQRRKQTKPVDRKVTESGNAEVASSTRIPWFKTSAILYAFKVLCGIVVFYIIYWSMTGHPAIKSLYKSQATVAGELLSWIGHPNKVIDNTIASQSETSNFRLTVAQGCEALDTVCIIIIALLFYPGIGWKSKLLGAVCGVLLTQSLNALRIISLYLVGIYAPDQFELVHYTIWPMILIVWIVCFWWLWLQFAPLSKQKDEP